MKTSCTAYTREAELALVSWDETQKEAFLRMQVDARHRSYRGTILTLRSRSSWWMVSQLVASTWPDGGRDPDRRHRRNHPEPT
jgi:hypothetical protein